MEDELHVGGIELENYRTVHEVSQSLLVNNYWKHNNKNKWLRPETGDEPLILSYDRKLNTTASKQ